LNKRPIQKRSSKTTQFGLSATVSDQFNLAVSLHQRHEFARAAQLYSSVLGEYPEHFDALQLYAVLLAQTGQLTKALNLLIKAVEVAPTQGVERSSLAGVYNNLGNTYKGLAEFEQALKSYTQATQLRPDYPDAFNNKGLVYFELGRFKEALTSLGEALRLNPTFFQALNNKGNVQRALGHYEDALSSFDQAIAINAQYAQAYSNKGLVLQDQKNWQAALKAYETALSYRPDYAEALYNSANVYQELGQAQAQNAVKFYLAAIKLRPLYADALNNLGSVYRQGGQTKEAMQCYWRSIEINPSYSKALYNLGNLFRDLRELDRAKMQFERAVWIDPSFAEAHLSIAMLELTRGNTECGWRGFEWRWKSNEIQRSAGLRHRQKPLWLGSESLKSKTILLYAEQGLGDTLQFCRYAQWVKRLGATVLLEVPSELLALLGSLSGVDRLIQRGDGLEAFDYQCPLMSLPLAINTYSQEHQCHDPHVTPLHAYITCDPQKEQLWRAWLDATAQHPLAPRIGIAWSGNPAHLNDRNRSVACTKLQEMLLPGPQFISLQKECSSSDQQLINSIANVLDVGARLTDFSDTAALISGLDLVITVDTSVAHLAGAMGKPVWVMLPFNSDWRWLEHGSSTHWYPSMRLYRQSRAGDWDGVLEEIKSDLRMRLISKMNLLE
jgi:tetratricopeptide (TPR) repeat protein